MSVRRGVSLIELIVTLSACSAILTTSAVLIHRALHAQSKAHAFFDGERSARRLAQQFRRDAHNAQAMETEDSSGEHVSQGKLLVRFTMRDGESVEYRQSSGRVERTERLAEQVGARESYEFSVETRFSAAASSPGVVSLSIEPAKELSNEPAQPLAPYAAATVLSIEDALGRNARLAPSQNDSQNIDQNGQPAP
jgi:hypothetical protein